MKIFNRMIATKILNCYAQDMGNYFDYVRGNEEEIYNDALVFVETMPFFIKIKTLIKKGGDII